MDENLRERLSSTDTKDNLLVLTMINILEVLESIRIELAELNTTFSHLGKR